MKPRTSCKHHRSQMEHKTCAAGVEFSKFIDLPFDERPCWRRHGCEAPGGCELQVFPTVEEEAEEERQWKELFERSNKARAAIVTHLGGPWKKGMTGAAGSIPCPICGTGELRFSRSGYNGHIHAACTTEDCVSWME